MVSGDPTRILIIVFDALRPEFVTADLMPNLRAFAEKGVTYSNSHSTFPTETRVNQSAVITGCYPARHGIVANKFLEPEAAPGQLLNTGDDVALEAAIARLDGRLLGVPTLGERLAEAGYRFATISAGTPGGGRLINHTAESHGSFRLAMKRTEVTVPAGAMDKVVKRIGTLPGFSRPAVDWISWAVDCYLSFVEPEISPDVMLLWLCEPDESFHFLGIGANDTLRAIRHVDAEFGRILAVHEGEIDAGRLQVIALSDHGQISLKGQPLDLVAKFRAAGFAAAAKPSEDAECVVDVGNAGGIWVRGSPGDRIDKIVDWIREQEWCGPIFTRNGVSGTLLQKHLGVDHRRSPDISVVLRSDDATNDWGLMGTTLHDAVYPAGGGCHGGLSTYELHNVLAMSGRAFKQGQIIEVPAGNIDIAPTVLALLGLDVPDGIDGRVLREALRENDESATLEVVEHVYSSSNANGLASHLSVSEFGGSRYLNRAWVA